MAANLPVGTYLGDNDRWDDPDPDYLALLANHVGGAAATTAAACSRSILNVAQRSPVALAILISGDINAIHVVHSPTRFPGDPLAPTPYDDKVVVLCGNDLQASVPLVLPDTAFSLVGPETCYTYEYMIGVNGHGAAPATVRFGPVPLGDPHAGAVSARKVMLLPFEAADDLVTTSPSGRYTLPGFYNSFIGPGVNHADAGMQARWTAVADWFRMASSDGAADPHLEVEPLLNPAPAAAQRLNAWATRVRDTILQRVGMGGPGLTTAAFNAGVAGIQNTLTATAQQALEFERARSNKTFTDRHGDALAERMHRLCGVADDDHLPDTHVLLAKASKGKDYAILAGQIAARVATSTVPLSAACMPLASTSLVDDVFRSFMPGATGLVFAKGLSPLTFNSKISITPLRRELTTKYVLYSVSTEASPSKPSPVVFVEC